MSRPITPALPLPSHSRPLLMAVLAVAVVFTAAAIGNLATLPNIPTWYAGLEKPSFNPPNGLFGPVWGILYVMMGYAFWRVLMLPAHTQGKGTAVGWFIIQMVLNGLWSVAFFSQHSPALGLIVIGLLWVAIIATTFRFATLDKLSAALLIPYLAWVSFAAVLNGFIWQLNR